MMKVQGYRRNTKNDLQLADVQRRHRYQYSEGLLSQDQRE